MARYGMVYLLRGCKGSLGGVGVTYFDADSFTDAVAYAYNHIPLDCKERLCCDLEKYAKRMYDKSSIE